MKKSKKIFILFAVAFAILLAYASYDISQRTTFPGSKPQLKERIHDTYQDAKVDSVAVDSLSQ